MGKALCDLGASVNMMPLSLYKRLSLGKVSNPMVKLQMADHSLVLPYGVCEDVVVKIDKLQIPVDFIICDIEEDLEVPLILGRPFLRTSKALIDVFKGDITLSARGEKVTFSVLESMKASDGKGCYLIETIEQDLNEYVNLIFNHDNVETSKHDVIDDKMNVAKMKSKLDALSTNELQVQEFTAELVQDGKLKDKMKFKAVMVDPESMSDIPGCSRDKVMQFLKRKPPNLDSKAFLEKLREINTSMTEVIQSEVVKWMKHLKSVFGKEAAESIMTIALEET